jgi:DNA-binding SARP family transcriptional activator/quercetin dioxygenase-like cupin family protein
MGRLGGEESCAVPHVTVLLLGGFEIRVGGRAVPAEAWRHQRAIELVARLALTPRHRLHREQAIEAFWPSLLPEAGAANLRKAAHHARRALGADDAIVLGGEHVSLWPDAEVEVDATLFERKAKAALESGDSQACAKVVPIYGGELLPDIRYEEWTEEPRRRLRALYLRLLRGAGLWEEVVVEEPADESATRTLMRLEAEAGNRSAALEHYDRLRAALGELGLQPAPETDDLRREIAPAQQTEHRSFGQPDETRTFPNGYAEILRIGDGQVGRFVFEPGWRWSDHVKPTVKTDSCEAPHYQYHVSGQLAICMDDGTEMVAGPGDITLLPSGHDAWVVGDDAVVVVDWFGASQYAKHR